PPRSPTPESGCSPSDRVLAKQAGGTLALPATAQNRDAHPSDHLDLDPVDRVSASELRLAVAVGRVGLRAQPNRARIGVAPREIEPLPGSLRAMFYLRLSPRRTAVDADLDPLDATIRPCPSPRLLRRVPLQGLPGRRRHDDGFRGDRPDRDRLS